MSTTISYIPTGDADKGIWMGNFNTKLPSYATIVGITAAEVTATQKDAAMYLYMLSMLEAYKQTVNNITSYKNLLKRAVGQQNLGAIPSSPTLATPPTGVPEACLTELVSW